jgi:hypothetical protein
MRVVIDTNIFISSFFGGNPKKIIDYWKNGKLILCLSKPIIDEYIEVLRRLGLQNEIELKELLDIFARQYNLLFTLKTPVLKIVEADHDDDKFIECAMAFDAPYIISGDKHLKSIKKYMNIEIISPADFIRNILPSI